MWRCARLSTGPAVYLSAGWCQNRAVDRAWHSLGTRLATSAAITPTSRWSLTPVSASLIEPAD